MDEAEARTMVFVYGTLKRGFPNHPLLAASASPFSGAASTAAPASLVVGPYSIPFLLPSSRTPCSSSGRLVSGELYAASPSALADLDALEVPHPLFPRSQFQIHSFQSRPRPQGTHLGVYERRRLTVVVDGTREVEAEAYFAHSSYAEALWRRCGGEAAEIGEYTMDHAARYVPPSGRSPGASGLIHAIHTFLGTATLDN